MDNIFKDLNNYLIELDLNPLQKQSLIDLFGSCVAVCIMNFLIENKENILRLINRHINITED